VPFIGNVAISPVSETVTKVSGEKQTNCPLIRSLYRAWAFSKISSRLSIRIRKEDASFRGQLPESWKETLGTWFFELLPAGSICGAPKPKTLDIIREAEKELHAGGHRGFYSGVCGVFDGQTLNSGVMIRFIEQTARGPVFKSGGGITHLSDVCKEYDEVYQKVYVPLG